MFHSETVARIIHEDRVRDLERSARDQRLLRGSQEPTLPSLSTSFVRPLPERRNPCAEPAKAGV